jgi:hypothetical protein
MSSRRVEGCYIVPVRPRRRGGELCMTCVYAGDTELGLALVFVCLMPTARHMRPQQYERLRTADLDIWTSAPGTSHAAGLLGLAGLDVACRTGCRRLLRNSMLTIGPYFPLAPKLDRPLSVCWSRPSLWTNGKSFSESIKSSTFVTQYLRQSRHSDTPMISTYFPRLSLIH